MHIRHDSEPSLEVPVRGSVTRSHSGGVQSDNPGPGGNVRQGEISVGIADCEFGRTLHADAHSCQGNRLPLVHGGSVQHPGRKGGGLIGIRRIYGDDHFLSGPLLPVGDDKGDLVIPCLMRFRLKAELLLWAQKAGVGGEFLALYTSLSWESASLPPILKRSSCPTCKDWVR